MEQIDIVDQDDIVYKTIPKDQRDTQTEIIRCSLVMLKDSLGRIGLQKRSSEESNYPLCWDCSAGGGVDAQENYLSAAQRELTEELGISSPQLEFLGKELFEYESGEREFIAIYQGEYLGETLKLQPEEVEEFRFLSEVEIQELLKKPKTFHPECLFVLQKYFGFKISQNR